MLGAMQDVWGELADSEVIAAWAASWSYIGGNLLFIDRENQIYEKEGVF